MRNIPGIIVHCSDSPQGRGDNAETIDRWHKERGFKRIYKNKTYHIGYHYVILESGIIENGRPLEITGAHASGFNDYIGICLIGRKSFTEEQMVGLEQLIKGLKVQFSIKSENIIGHYAVSHKTCPNIDIEEFKRDINLM